MSMFVPEEVKKDFPILRRMVNGKSLVYLDSGATSQKPEEVLKAMDWYYRNSNANIHRGAHTLGDEATMAYEDARVAVAEFIGANHKDEVIFTRNTTEAINLVAYVWAWENLKKNDVIVATEMEHHSNIVPWQQIAARTGATVEYVTVTDEGILDMKEVRSRIRVGVKLVTLTHVSNALGTINPVSEVAKLAHKVGAKVLVDGAQAVPHMPVNMKRIGVDFYVFSGHKCLGPMGIGVLWARREILEEMEPFLTGGGMINEVGKEGTTWTVIPERFEAGTPNVAGAVGLWEAVRYLDKLGMEAVREHDKEIVEYALSKLAEVPEVSIIGPTDPELRSGSVSFEYRGVHAHDVATVLDSEGVAVRSGHHCTMILHKAMKVPASVRASFNVYTTHEDIDRLVKGLAQVKKVFGE